MCTLTSIGRNPLSNFEYHAPLWAHIRGQVNFFKTHTINNQHCQYAPVNDHQAWHKLTQSALSYSHGRYLLATLYCCVEDQISQFIPTRVVLLVTVQKTSYQLCKHINSKMHCLGWVNSSTIQGERTLRACWWNVSNVAHRCYVFFKLISISQKIVAVLNRNSPDTDVEMYT